MTGRKWLGLFFVLFLIGMTGGVLTESLLTQKDQKQIDHSLLEKIIQKRQSSLNEMLKNFPAEVLLSQEQAWATMDSLSRSKGNSLLIYRNNQLVAWSNQNLPVTGIHPIFFNQPVIQLENGWYLIQKFQHGSFLLVGLSLIKQDYPYENNFLSNSFQLSTGLNPSVKLSREPQPAYSPVYGLEGEYLFSISTPQVDESSPSETTISILFYVIGLIALWLLLLKWMGKTIKHKWANLYLLGSLAAFSALYFIVFWHNEMALFNHTGLFSPIHFAMSDLLPSLGALLLLAILLVLNAYWIFRFIRWPRFLIRNHQKPFVTSALFLALIMIVEVCFLVIVRLIYQLVEHSSGPTIFFKVLDLNNIALVKVLIIALLFFSFILLTEKSIRLLINHLPKLWLEIIVVFSTLAMMFLTGKLGYGHSDWGLVFAGVVALFMIFTKRTTDGRHSYNTFIWLVGLFAIFSGSLLIDLTIHKEEQNRELLVENLSFQLLREEDPVAEMYLEDLETQILRDVILRQQLAQPELNQSAIRNHLLKYYFYGYWGRYDLQILTCWPQGNIVFEETGEEHNCYQFFFDTIKEQGHLINGSDHFYFLDNDNGRVSYLGVFPFFTGHTLEATLFIELHSKPYFEGLGYPELLLNQREQERQHLFKDYSYAKYVNGKLVKRSGTYNYTGNLRQLQPGSQLKTFVKDADYSHLLFQPEPDTVVILSKKDMEVADVFIALSILFILFFLLGLLFEGLMQLPNLSTFQFSYSIQKRIQITFVVLMLVLLSVVALGTVIYTARQFKSRHMNLLDEKVKSVLLEMESKIGLDGPLNPDMNEYLTYHLQTISNIFFCDINLFAPDGMLIASSRPELFEKGLVGSQMNPRAYFQMVFKNKTRFLDEESIGDLKYTSFYVPFFSRNETLLGYVNVPYFVANNELREEVSSVIVTIVNFYLLFSLIIIGLAVFLARQITRPLLVIQAKLAEVKIDRHNEKIDYVKDDEIGGLVAEYNRMVDELAASATKLAQNERELAWREMARQIAHEIKNPLTPMKLSIQYLQRAWNDQVPDFDSFMKRVTNTLIEQIEKLSSIAREFSHFAMMPAARREEIDLLDKIRKSTTLFENNSLVTLKTDFGNYSQIIVSADGEQLLGVFNNLINNAIQAIPVGTPGEVIISANISDGKVVIAVRDNGKGIPRENYQNMFVPNFTTKSSGMGLGLAIVKSTVESAGGSVWFESALGEGTTFYVQLPIVSQS